MNFRTRLRTIGSTLGLLGALATPSNAGVFRVDALDQKTTVDTRLGFTVTPKESPVTIDLFTRARVHADYHGNASYGAFVDINTQLGKGFAITLEGDSATKTTPYLIIGPTYTGSVRHLGDVLFFPNVQITGAQRTLGTIFNYDRDVTLGGQTFHIRSENITSWNPEEGKALNSITERLRIGIKLGEYTLGPAIDFTETNKKGVYTSDTHYGGFVEKKF